MSTPAFTPHDFWLRSYELAIALNTGKTILIASDDQEPNALRFTFDVKMQVGLPLWWAEISIYNLAPSIMNEVIHPGSGIVLQAGYATGPHKMATIFQGKVFQPMWTRENVVDYKLTLRCFAGNAKNWVDTNYPRLQTEADLVNLMARTAQNQMHVGHLDPILSQTKLSRGGVLLGDPNQILGDIASGHGLVAWVDPTAGINIVDLGKLVSGGALAPTHDLYAPPIPPGSDQKAKTGTDYCIIGAPQQTWEGVNFEVLLDPSLKIKYPPDVVKLDMSSTIIDLLPLSQPFGNDSQGFIPPPTASGNYIVAGLRHYGDSRGNPWYSEICGVTQNGLLLAMGKPQ